MDLRSILGESTPLKGWDKNTVSVPEIENLSDEQLNELNEMIDWKCFVVDSKGRRFGKPAHRKKRSTPQVLPDYRLNILKERVNLSESTVLEVGCFEGIHTVGLCREAKKVLAIDSRIANVVKTMVRTQFFKVYPEVFVYDLENINNDNCQRLQCDVLHHVGVLYHLHNPVEQIRYFRKYVNQAILLDTHYATPEMAKDEYQSSGQSYKYYRYKEQGYKDTFSGMKDHAKWLLLDDIKALLVEAGFPQIEVVELREERNGPRVLLIAKA